MWAGPHWFFPFTWGLSWVFFLAIALLCFRAFAFRRHAWGCRSGYGGPFDAEAILKRRLASGEIGEADYQRLKELLGK